MLNKMKSLIAQLKEADAAYYGKDNPYHDRSGIRQALQ